MRLNATRLGSITSSRSFGDQLYDLAGERPNLDLNFAGTKTLDPRVTFTRASSATYTDSAGVLRSAVTNLLLRSEEFGTTWGPNNITISPDAIAAPNGTLTADKLIATTTNGAHQLYQVTSGTSGVTYTISFYVKEGEYKRFKFGPGNTAVGGADKVVEINLALSNPIVFQDAIFNSSAFVISVGNGWYRVGATFTATATGTMTVAVLQTIINNAGSSSFAGDGTSGIYAWGAQLEQSSTVGEYIPTTSTINSAPRFDHNPTTGESLGLLVEEARTNSLTNNTMVGAVAGTPGTNPTGWLFVSPPGGITKEIIGAGTESGINYIDFRFSGTTTNANGIAIAPGNGAALTGQTWNASTYWKLAGGSTAGVSAFNIGIIEETLGGVFITGAFYGQTAPTSASLISQRPTATRTLTGGVTVAQVRHTVSLTIPTSTAIDFTLRIGLPQLEQGAFATSPIPTTTATVTRAADVASITGSNFSSWYNQTEGTWFVHHDVRQLLLIANNNSFSERQPQMGLASNLVHDFYSITGGAVQANNIGSTHVMGTPDRVAYALKNNDFIGACNGSLTAADTSGSLGSSITQLNIGAFQNGSSVAGGTFRRLTYWPVRLANTTLQAISQP